MVRRLPVLLVLIVLVTIGISFAVYTFTGNDCRAGFAVGTYPYNSPISGARITVDEKVAITDASGFAEITGLRCGVSHVVSYSAEGYQSGEFEFPEVLLLGPRDVGFAPILILMHPA